VTEPANLAGRAWAVDTGPLIFLSKLGHLDLLKDAASTICVAEAVIDEIQAKPDEAARAINLACQFWLSVRQVTNRQAVEILLADLGRGESETIVLAKEIEAERVVMDDLDARRFAHRVGLKSIGTLGLLLAARLDGRIASLRREIENLADAGFHATPELVDRVLTEAGERES
jgi:predicted nucleic acid-binding protein